MNHQDYDIPRTFPKVLLWLIATIAVVFLLQLLVPPFNRFAVNCLAHDTAAFIARGRLWQAVTAIFLHGSIPHLLGNMFFLMMFGFWLAHDWRWQEFLGYFLFCGVMGSVFFHVFNCLRRQPAIGLGASGAVFGIMIAAAMIYGQRVVQFFGIVPLKVRTLAAICFGLEIVLLLAAVQDGVGHIAHLGGAVAGAVLLKAVWARRKTRAGRVAAPTANHNRIGGLEFFEHEQPDSK